MNIYIQFLFSVSLNNVLSIPSFALESYSLECRIKSKVVQASRQINLFSVVLE